MPGFENYVHEAEQIEREIVRKGLVLGIDWEDEVQVRSVARAALKCRSEAADCQPDDATTRARIELFGLAQLMLTVMRQSADDGMLTHGGPAWKSLARALWREAEDSFVDK